MPAPVHIGPFNHATINCRDVRRGVAFYRDMLGLEEVQRPGFDFVGAWLYREGLGMMLHLIEDPNYTAECDGPIQTRRRHLAFRVEDFDAAVALLEQHGIEVVHRLLPDYGYRQAFLRDPDGNVIELGEWPNAQQLAKPI